MHIHVVPNRGSPPTVLLRESYREGAKVRKRTLANLSSLSLAQIEAIRAVLRGEELRPVASSFEVTASRAHGHVQVIVGAMQRLGLASLIASKHCRERDLVLAMVAARILAPSPKLAITRWWHTTTLAEDFGVADASEDDLYAAMDWLLQRQDRIQKKLATRHLHAGGLVLYDLSSSYFEGTTCPLAKRGYSRDGKPGTLQVNFGLLTDGRGCPVAVSVHEGNTADSTTFMPEVQRLRTDFGIERMVMVGDRGMITQTQIDEIKGLAGVDWITALRSEGIKTLMAGGALQMGLFDERNLFEMTHPDYPGERLVACLNPELRKLRGHKRRSLLDATSRELEKVRTMVQRGRLKGKDQGEIGVRVGEVINKYKMAKHVVLDIRDSFFDFHIDEKKVAAEAALDGIYVIRTSLEEDQASAEDAVRHYKKLVLIEQAYRSLKTIDLKTRPIRHYTEDRVRAHIFLCMLAYYVEWHMREAWRELLFCDEDQEAKNTRDAVAPAQRSKAALNKVHSRVLDDGSEVHSFQTLLKLLSAVVRNVCRVPRAGPDAPTFEVVTTPNAKQRRAFDLLDRMSWESP